MKIKFYKTSELAKLFGKSTTWVYWAEREGVFCRPDGTMILPPRTTPPRATSGYRRYSTQNVIDIAGALYRRGIIEQDEYESVLRTITGEEVSTEKEYQ